MPRKRSDSERTMAVLDAIPHYRPRDCAVCTERIGLPIRHTTLDTTDCEAVWAERDAEMDKEQADG